MEVTICLTKEDIITRRCGRHIEVQTPKGLTINFTPEAAKELVEDLGYFLSNPEGPESPGLPNGVEYRGGD